MDENRVYMSERGHPLVYHGSPGKVPILTVENYLKWYSLYLVNPDGSVEPVDFPEDGYCDHVPYPAAVEEMAADRGWVGCYESLEMIVGRYVLEFLDRDVSKMRG
jgi:hypothetical protein